ncbi:hypothetical protein BGP_3566 [Beggiatoa sp. PS]|nr:hypothetical protein BGP_3566 [Beggiatoa sp. PS]
MHSNAPALEPEIELNLHPPSFLLCFDRLERLFLNNTVNSI